MSPPARRGHFRVSAGNIIFRRNPEKLTLPAQYFAVLYSGRKVLENGYVCGKISGNA